MDLVGKIFVSTWGYDQTNVDFYVVVRQTAHNVWLARVLDIEREQIGYEQYYVKPADNAEHSKETIRRKYSFSTIDGAAWVSITNYSSARLWDGKPVLETRYA